MPQTAYKENNKLVYVLPRLATAVAAQRNVQVITEPACQADVPAPPQLGKGAGVQRLAEDIRQQGARILEGAYPGYRLVEVQVRYSAFVTGAYIEARMARKGSGKREA